MFEAAVSDLRYLVARKLNATSTSPTPIPASEEWIDWLIAKVSSLEEGINGQTTKLEGLRTNRLLLLKKRVLKKNINNLMTKITKMADNASKQRRVQS